MQQPPHCPPRAPQPCLHRRRGPSHPCWIFGGFVRCQFVGCIHRVFHDGTGQGRAGPRRQKAPKTSHLWDSLGSVYRPTCHRWCLEWWLWLAGETPVFGVVGCMFWGCCLDRHTYIQKQHPKNINTNPATPQNNLNQSHTTSSTSSLAKKWARSNAICSLSSGSVPAPHIFWCHVGMRVRGGKTRRRFGETGSSSGWMDRHVRRWMDRHVRIHT